MKPITIDVALEEGMAITAAVDKWSIRTDLPGQEGGNDSAPNPFQLFLASLASCAGVYARRFCQSRGLSDEGLGLSLCCEFHPEKFQVTKITCDLRLPEGFPEKYRAALIRSVDLCTVKKHLMTPPEFDIRIVD